MRVDDLVRLYDYGYWANARLLAALAPLTPAQFTQPVAGGHESIRNTLVHVMSAEWGWVDRCGGPPRGERLPPHDYPTVAALAARWREVEGLVRGYLAGLADADLSREVTFTLGGGPPRAASAGSLLLHSVLHAAHHRGQVALLIRQLGHAPGEWDLLYFALEHRDAAPGY